MKKKRPHHRLAVAVYQGFLGFEFSVVSELLGLERSGLTESWYDFRVCRVERGDLRSSHGLIANPSEDLNFLRTAQTVVVPGWRNPLEKPKPAFLKALTEAYQNGARIVSICTGAFVLGAAGLLDRRRCTTHWLHLEELENLFPTARIEPHTLYVRDGRIFTSAGSSAGIDLCLHLIRMDFGHEIAVQVAKRMVAPAHREGGQSQYASPIILEGDDEELGPVLDWLRRNLETNLSVSQIASKFRIPLRSFQRRFQLATGLSPTAWLNDCRVESARDLLETTNFSIDEIAERSGLGTPTNLRKHFSRRFRSTPTRYRQDLRQPRIS